MIEAETSRSVPADTVESHAVENNAEKNPAEQDSTDKTPGENATLSRRRLPAGPQDAEQRQMR